jgi:sulfite reductase (NADPH) flavoprotein alpha-component
MQPVHILFGTESGNAQSLAKRAGDALKSRGIAATIVDMADFKASTLPELACALVITSTYGNGDPPSNAEALHAFVMKKCPPLPGLSFSVCALGDTTYDRFAQCGKDFDARLGDLGATRLVPRVDCDVDYDPPFERWLADVLVALAPRAGSTAAPESTPKTVAAVTPVAAQPIAEQPASPAPIAHDAPGTRRNPVRARVLANTRLGGSGSGPLAKEIRHVVLDATALPSGYEPGDSIGIHPENDPTLVDAILAAARLSGGERVEVGGASRPLRDALARHLEIQSPDARLVDRLCGTTDAYARKAALETSHVIDLLRSSTSTLSADDLADLLRPLAPRLYSIASSPRVHPGEVHLCVDVLRYELAGIPRTGVASSHLAGRAEPGAEVSIHLHPTPSFRLAPRDRDIVMIGPGTGVAPFRAFLEERAREPGTGRSWLFFGARHRATDFLYQAELERWAASGVLTRLDLAFSRDQADKVYVQHKLLAARGELAAWIEGGATIYVCGDAHAMAPDVHRALAFMLSDGRDGNAVLAELERQGRYVRDVY